MRHLLFLAAALFAPVQWVHSAQDLPSLETPGLKNPKDIIPMQLQSLELLRTMTKLTLDNIDSLYSDTKKYQMIQDLYLENPKDKEVLYKTAKMASDLLKKIKSANLEHTIDPDFMKELRMFDKIYKKNELKFE